MANILKIRKVTSLPSTYDASTMYLVRSETAGLFEIYVSSDDGATVRHLINQAEIQSMITNAIAGFSTVDVVANIAARDALNPSVVKQVIVLDATGDPTVSSGSATYVYDLTNTTWVKISEAESLDVVLQWNNIVGRPSSTVAEIDDAVAKRHTHGNKPVLDDLSAASGHLYYSGQPIRAFLDEETW